MTAQQAIQAALPVVYSLGSALTLVYLSRKPVHLDQYEALRTDDDLDQEASETNTGSPIPSESESSVVDHVQAQYQAQRSSGMTINLARLGLTAVQLGLALFSIVLLRSSTDHRHRHGETQTDRLSILIQSAQAFSWAYALALAFVHIIRPAVSHQFWIRPQLDMFYVLQLTLSSIHLYRTDVFDEPASEWPLWLKLDILTWATGLFLIVVTLTTRPYQPPTPPKKHTPGSVPRLDSSEYSSSIAGRLFFSWVNPLVFLGYKRSVQDVDLPHLEVSDFSWYIIRQHDLAKLAKKGTFTRTLMKALQGEFFIQFLWSIPWCFFVNISPYCLNKILQYIECRDCGAPTAVNYMYVFGLLFASLGDSVCMQAALHKGRRIYIHCVSICNAEVFAKTLRRKDMVSHEDKTDEDGQTKKDDGSKKDGTLNISNLIAVDVRKMEQPFSYAFYMYGYPIQFLIAGYQLYQVLGYAALVGIAFLFGSYPLPAKLYSMIMDLFKDIMNTKDERMDALNEMLSAIRIVKFFGWESKFEEKITTARNKELARTRESYKQIIMADIVWVITPVLNIVVVLLSYTKLFGHTISASKIFTTLALFNIMRQALNNLPWTIKSTMQAVVSLNRINKFLQEEELVKDTVVTKIDGKASASHPIIGFHDATFVWPNKENDKTAAKPAEKKLSWFQKVKAKFVKATPVVEEPVAEPEAVQERFKLQNINVDFPVGKLSVIVGATGSGKSALLLALLGELDRVEGNVYLPRLDSEKDAPKSRGSGIAYVAQTAWLQNTTIRNNILFGREFDQDRYDAVVEGCALATDFDILEAGDATEIGEQGITLSGGQKQRVSLARAIYSAADVLLLDDCLSAVDSHTGKQLFQTLNGPLLYGRTILMATHQVQLTVNAASLVVVLERGEVLGSGTPEVVINNGWVDNVSYVQPPSGDDSEVSTLRDEERAQKSKKAPKKKVVSKLTEDEKKEEGAVAWSVYRTYLNASGGWPFWITIVILYLVREFVDISQNAWLAIWANKASSDVGSFAIKTFNAAMPEPVALSLYSAFGLEENGEYGTVAKSLFGKGTPDSVNVEYYLGVYILLSLLALVFAAATNLYTILGGLAASRVLHERLLHKVTRAKVRFYDTTPIGRIVNRFSSDISTVDEEVSMGVNGLFSSFVTILGIIVIISANMTGFLIPAVFIMGVYAVIGSLYVPISRDLKRLNSNSRSPILNHFNETLNGLATIRAYGFERQFLSKNLTNLDDNNRTFFLLWSTNRWLHWRVDVAGASVSFITGILVLQNWGKIAPGWAALSLTYSLMFTNTIVWVIRMYATNEMNLNSVERIAEYMDLEEEPAAIIDGSRPPASWPHAGEITVDHLVMKYAADTPAVIKDVSFRIKAGEKVGIVGRTGSGKSTFAISLFRFMDPTSGSITIDGIDITKIGLQDLRTNLTIIPQDPILFKGTLRSNLDPFGEREDRDLWEALRRSHLIPASAAPSKRTSLDITNVSGSSDSPVKTPAGSIKGSVSGESDVVDPSKITLDTPVKENGSNFSQGQRQLIALARALVRQSKIIVMDEATASVDFETDLKIQGTIRQEMSESTIITIAHRIRTIADFDRVLVMNAGEVAEFDKPLTLMRQEDSLFRSMCERSSEFDALIAIAEEKERQDAENAL